MKHLLLLLTGLMLISFSARTQYVTIPDANLRATLMQRYPTCFNASNMMDTSNSLIVNEPGFDYNGNVTNWDGFQYFKNLTSVYLGGNFPYIPNLPNSVTTFTLLGCHGFTSLPNLPTGLRWLTCRWTDITSLPGLPNTLTYLYCASNSGLTALPVLPSSLVSLICYSNNLSSLPALPNSLDSIDCSSNHLSTLPTLPPLLRGLKCQYNQLITLPALPSQLRTLDAPWNYTLSSLPALPATLKYLDCNANNLTSLPALPTQLEYLDVGRGHVASLPTLPSTLVTLNIVGGELTSLPALPAGIQTLFVNSNHLTTVPTLPAAIRFFACNGNLITSLPPLPEGIQTFTCYYNQLTELPAFPNSLTGMWCMGNNIRCLPLIPTTPVYLYPGGPVTSRDFHFDNRIRCIPNSPVNVNITVVDSLSQAQVFSGSASSFPLCNPANNCNHCHAYPVMEGYVYHDLNNNLIKDVNELGRMNVKVQLSNGDYTFTMIDGHYQIAADSIGTYSLNPAIGTPFTPVPLQYNYNFSSYDTLVTGDFALQSSGICDSVSISIIPTTSTTRRGQQFSYMVLYENDGTTTLSPDIVLTYDSSKLVYNNCSNAAVINNGNRLTLSETGFVPGIQESYMASFTVKTTATLADSIKASALITANAAADRDSCVVIILGSYDPNNKKATPSLTPAQVTNGDYIYYTIYFQNTGTDTAFNVVVTDTLNSLLQSSTVEMIATSHPCITTVKGDRMAFEFINIMLPDSNINELKSHGFIAFRVKPQNNVALNSNIANKASIYFDYNSPVNTNTAITTITEPFVVPLKLLSFAVSRGMGLNANLYWQTSNEINMKQYEIEMSLDGRIFNKIDIEHAKGGQYNSYTRTVSTPAANALYFRLKMIDIDGHYTYSDLLILRNDQVNNAFSFVSNPVKNELGISLQDESLRNTSASIFNSQAAIVKTILLQRDVEWINISTLPPGTYYLVTEKGSRQFVVVK